MKKSFNYLLACAIILICGCSGNHLINNKEYRSKVESSFKEREQLAHNRKDKLFNVFESGLSLQQEEALKFLFAYMPLSDLADYNGDFFLANANIALKTRKESTWGKSIPEDIFLHYVLPFRIFGENLDSFRIAYFDEIQSRVKGMDATDAALEINHWCHEKVIYQPSGGWISSPICTILSARGRCGEESIFTVASLRTVGIPARGVRTQWAHNDDDHAWVEVWIDGKWYYMGACEPEPVLDRAYFTEQARRSMLIGTKSFGAKYGQENTTVCYRNNSDVNTLSNYAVTKQIYVKVLDTNNVPVKDALVEYLQYNNAVFHPLAEVPTVESGISQFETGLGDLLIWARKGDDFNFKKVSLSDIDTLDLILNLKPADHGFQELDLGIPIVRAPLKGPATELIAANTKRINEENTIRQAYIDSWMKPEEAANLAKELGADPEIIKDVISRSMGNYKNIALFLTHTPVLDRSLAINLLKQVTDPDLRNTKEDIYADHLNNVIRFENTHGAYDYELYSKYVLNPKIANVMIAAWRKYLFESMPAGFRQDAINDPSILIRYVNNNIVIDDSEDYYSPPLSPKGVDELKVSDSFSRDVYFVALCRSLGIPSRIELGSNGYGPQYYFKNEWHDVWFAGRNQPLPGKGFIRFSSDEKNPVPEYFTHFTIAQFKNGHYNTLYKSVNFKDELALAPGHYMLVTGNRINDSKILSTLSFFELKENEHKTIDIKLRKDVSPAEILGTIDLNTKISLPDKSGITLKSIADKGIVLVWIDPNKEPTKHLFNDLLLLKPELDNWGGYFIFLSNQSEASNNFKLESIKGLPANSLYSADIDSKILKKITKSVSLSDIPFPFLVLADKNGNIKFKSAGYRIGIGEQILKKIGYELSGNEAFPSTSNGTSWTAVNTGLTPTAINALAVNGSNLFAGTDKGVFLSTNNGTNWTKVNNGLTNTYIHFNGFLAVGSKLYAGTKGGVFLSTNNGTSWTALNIGMTNTAVKTIAVSGTNLFAGTDSGVFLSTDNGRSWTAVNTGLASTSILTLAVSGTNLFAGTKSGGGVFRSTDNGSNWTVVNRGLTNTLVGTLAVNGTNLFAGTEGGAFLSTNNGANWTEIGLTKKDFSAFAWIGTNFFAGAWSGGVFLSANNSTSWTNAGLTDTQVLTLAISGTNLFVGTYEHGIFRRPIADIIDAAKGVK